MRPVDIKSRNPHGLEVLKRALEGRHAVSDVADIVGSPKEEENAQTLMDSLQHNPWGDLVVGPDEDWTSYESLEIARRVQSGGDF